MNCLYEFKNIKFKCFVFVTSSSIGYIGTFKWNFVKLDYSVLNADS